MRIDNKRSNISFIMPAYNCESTVAESVESIFNGNFTDGDECIIVNDCSTDNTEGILLQLQAKYPPIRIAKHKRNKGGAAARNTAVENTTNPIIFCLDSDNILAPESIPRLKEFMVSSGADIAAFQEIRYFQENTAKITHKWVYKKEPYTLADYLCGPVAPGASGNYMFTKESWERANGYPEFAGALDTWGFGFRQVATASKMICMPDSYYFHRYGHESYWVRESKARNTSLTALQIIIPFLQLLNESDIDYIMSRRGRYTWFYNKENHPIRLKTGEVGKTGSIEYLKLDKVSLGGKIAERVRALMKKVTGISK